MEDIDIAFNHWYNQAQPLEAIVKQTVFRAEEARAIKSQIKHAFTHGYARGVADTVARPIPDDPELGPVR
jgi:hypothetical protein